MPYRYTINQIYGFCPVQADGTIDGKKFYFRARHNSWRFNVDAADPIGPDVEFSYGESYGTEAYEAGWMKLEEAEKFIEQAANLYFSREKQ